MAGVQRRTLDIRWIKKPRYRQYIVLGSIIFSVNVLIVHVFVNSAVHPSLDEEDPSGRGRYHTETGVSPYDDDPIHGDNQFAMERKRHIAAENEIIQRRKLSLVAGKRSQISTATVPYSLNPAELDFVPACNITTREAVSAIRRAGTQHCKKQIVDVVCLAQNKQLYPTTLSSLCPSPDMTSGKALGCYQDSKSLRLLTGYFTNLQQANSPVNCTNLCLQSGFPYAGVEYWTECFCGAEAPAESLRLPDASCNMKCPSDSSLICGGYFTINIYQTGIAKFSPQVAVETSKADATPVRICYLLTVSGRALRQIKRFIRALYHKDHYFYIHVDARQDYLFRELIYLEQTLPNVKLMRKRHATMWAGSSLLQMLLSAMSDVLALPWHWDFILNLSESDFTVKNNRQLVEFLTANKGKNFVKSTGRDIQRFIQKQGLDKTFVECDGHMWRVGDRTLPAGVQMDGGSDWLALSRQFVAYVAAKDRDPLLTGLDSVYRYTLLPAESFFHTVLRNSHFCNTYIDNNLHLTNWKRHLGCKCQYKHIVDWCGCSPNDFTPEDWPRITGTTPNNIFFARKFEAIINQAVINKLEDWVYGLDHKKIVNALSYWQSIYHHQDLSPPRDDLLVTLSESLGRLAASFLAQYLNVPLLVDSDDIIELSSYHHDDIFQGILVRYKAKTVGGSSPEVKLESWFKLRSHFKLLDEVNGKFIQNVYVSSNFDVKEQTTRALHAALGPLSDVSVVFVVAIDQPTNLTFLFVDPAGQLAQVVDVHVSDKSMNKIQTGSAKAVISSPLLPGTWQVHVYHSGFYVAISQFLVLPLQVMTGQPLSEKQAALMHGGGLYKISPDKAHWSSALEEKGDLLTLANLNSKRTGHDLTLWIDSLSKGFYSYVDSCHIYSPSSHLEECAETVWSSQAPDPKSTISGFDAIK